MQDGNQDTVTPQIPQPARPAGPCTFENRRHVVTWFSLKADALRIVAVRKQDPELGGNVRTHWMDMALQLAITAIGWENQVKKDSGLSVQALLGGGLGNKRGPGAAAPPACLATGGAGATERQHVVLRVAFACERCPPGRPLCRCRPSSLSSALASLEVSDSGVGMPTGSSGALRF